MGDEFWKARDEAERLRVVLEALREAVAAIPDAELEQRASEFWEIREGVERMLVDLKAYREKWPSANPQLDHLEALDAELLRIAKRLGMRVVKSEEDETQPS